MNDPRIRDSRAVVKDPDTQQAVWFLGALVTELLGGSDTADALAVLEHTGGRGYNAPMHFHHRDDETFVVLDGHLKASIAGELTDVPAGSSFFLPRRTVHGFVVTSPGAKFLTLHTPAGFERFLTEAGAPAAPGERDLHRAEGAAAPSPEELTAIAARYGIEIVGPPPLL